MEEGKKKTVSDWICRNAQQVALWCGPLVLPSSRFSRANQQRNA
jgi:hypothetical protein